jgi:hypothetical protein
MGRYLLLMYNKEMRMPKNPTKKQMEEGIRPWTEYLAPLTKKRKLESVAPVQRNGKMLTPSGTKEYRASKVDIGGFMVVRAKSMAEAIKIAKSSPHARSRMGTTTIRECVEM